MFDMQAVQTVCNTLIFEAKAGNIPMQGVGQVFRCFKIKMLGLLISHPNIFDRFYSIPNDF